MLLFLHPFLAFLYTVPLSDRQTSLRAASRIVDKHEFLSSVFRRELHSVSTLQTQLEWKSETKSNEAGVL